MEISGQCYMVFLAVSLLSLAELCSFWYSLSDLFSLHKLVGNGASSLWRFQVSVTWFFWPFLYFP